MNLLFAYAAGGIDDEACTDAEARGFFTGRTSLPWGAIVAGRLLLLLELVRAWE